MTSDLEIGVYRWDAASYTVDLRCDADDAGTRRQSAPLPLPFDRLRALQASPEQYGRALWLALFADPAIRSAYAGLLAASGQGAVRVRLYLSPNVPELHGLRWETLYDA